MVFALGQAARILQDTLLGKRGAMNIADERVHRVLSYIAELEKRGFPPNSGDIQRYASNPYRSSDLNIMRHVSELGKQSVANYLEEMRWIEGEDDNATGVRLSSLGRAVLKALDEEQKKAEPPEMVVLDDRSPLSYARLIREVSRLGECMIADPYFRLESLKDVVAHTACTRLLTSKQIGDEELAGLAVAVRDLSAEANRTVDARVSSDREFHDRFVIPLAGPVLFVGVSFGGIRKNFSIMGKINEPIASIIREKYEAFWAASNHLG